VLQANLRYIDAACELLVAKVADDFVYRICRKRLLDSVAGLSSALTRMLDEPPSKQRAVEDIHLFIVQNYLIVAHVAALRLLLRRHAVNLPKTAVDALLLQTCSRVGKALGQVGETLTTLLPELAAFAEARQPAAPASLTAENSGGDQREDDYRGASDWSGWALLQRRLALLQADADKIAVRGILIGRALARPG
jgi:uncharacterized membrane protein YccC